MPTYEYDCGTCGTFEVTQRITDKPLRRCPTCKGKVRKLISSTSFQLKGSGWYVTDSRPTPSESSSSSSSSDKSSGSTSSSSAPASTTAAAD